MWADPNIIFKREDVDGTVDIEYNKKQADALQKGADLVDSGQDIQTQQVNTEDWKF